MLYCLGQYPILRQALFLLAERGDYFILSGRQVIMAGIPIQCRPRRTNRPPRPSHAYLGLSAS